MIQTVVSSYFIEPVGARIRYIPMIYPNRVYYEVVNISQRCMKPLFPSACRIEGIMTSASVSVSLPLPACVCVYVCWSVCPSVCFSLLPFARLSVFVCLCLSVCLYVCLPGKSAAAMYVTNETHKHSNLSQKLNLYTFLVNTLHIKKRSGVNSNLIFQRRDIYLQ